MPLEQVGVAVAWHWKFGDDDVPTFVSVPLLHVGAGGVTAHVPDEAVKVPGEQLGDAEALQV